MKTGDKAGALEALKHYVTIETTPEAKHWIDHANGVIAELSAAAPPRKSRRQARSRRRRSETPAARRRAPRLAPARTPGGVEPPATANTAYVEAQALRDRGHIDDAIAKFQQAIADDPQTCSAARTALGELLLKIRRDDEAIDVFRATVDKNPSYSLAWYDLAFALRARGRAAEAVDAYEHYIKLKPSDPDPYYGLGRALQTPGAHRRRPARVRDLRVAGEATDRTALGRIRRSADQDARPAAVGSVRMPRELRRRTTVSSGRSSVKVAPRAGRALDRQRATVRLAICRPM